MVDSNLSMAADDTNLLDCFVNLTDDGAFPLTFPYKACATAQESDAEVQQLPFSEPDN